MLLNGETSWKGVCLNIYTRACSLLWGGVERNNCDCRSRYIINLAYEHPPMTFSCARQLFDFVFNLAHKPLVVFGTKKNASNASSNEFLGKSLNFNYKYI